MRYVIATVSVALFLIWDGLENRAGIWRKASGCSPTPFGGSASELPFLLDDTSSLSCARRRPTPGAEAEQRSPARPTAFGERPISHR